VLSWRNRLFLRFRGSIKSGQIRISPQADVPPRKLSAGYECGDQGTQDLYAAANGVLGGDRQQPGTVSPPQDDGEWKANVRAAFIFDGWRNVVWWLSTVAR